MNDPVLADHGGDSAVEAIKFCLLIRDIGLFDVKIVAGKGRDVELKITDVGGNVKLYRDNYRLAT